MAKFGKTIKDVIRGDTRQVNCIFTEADGTTRINLTGGTAYFTVNSSDDPSGDIAPNMVLQKTATSFTNPSQGEHTFTLTHTDTNIPAAEYWYDAQYVDSSGNYVSSYRGKFIVQSDITRT